MKTLGSIAQLTKGTQVCADSVDGTPTKTAPCLDSKNNVIAGFACYQNSKLQPIAVGTTPPNFVKCGTFK